MEATEQELVQLINEFVALPFYTGFDRLTTYNLDHHSQLMDRICAKVMNVANERQSLTLMEAANRITNRKAAHLREWIRYREENDQRLAALEQRHIERIAQETADEQSELLQWIG